MTHTFLMNFLISQKLLQASQAPLPWGMPNGLHYHSAVFISSPCHLFTSAWSFYIQNPRDFLLADEGSDGLRSHGTHGGLSEKETVNAGRNSCAVIFAYPYLASGLQSAGIGLLGQTFCGFVAIFTYALYHKSRGRCRGM